MATKKGTVVKKPVTPTADVNVTAEGFEITVGPGNYELYVDKKFVGAITQDQARERFLPMDAGEHLLGVYSQGRFVTPGDGIVGVFETVEHPAEEPASEPEPQQPAGEPVPPDTGTVSVSREYVEQLAHELRDLSDMLFDWLGK